MTAQDVAEKIASVKGMQPRRMGSEWLVRCPCADHEDRNPSLSVGEGDKRDVVLYCHAGCHVDDVLRAAGLTRADLNGHSGQDRAPQTVYDYVDETGRLLFQVVRKPGKKFVQRRPDGTGWTYKLGDTRRVPYMLPELLAAVADGRPVYVVEGEKDVLTLTARGLVATCNPGGAGKWRDTYSPRLAGATVTVVADDDPPGRDHARKVATSLGKVAASVAVVVPTMGKDITDHLAAGGTLDQLVPMTLVTGHDTSGGGVPPPSLPLADVLDDAEAFVRRFCVLPTEHGFVATVLWAAHTHSMDSWESTPRLAFLSPEPGSGKTRCLEVLVALVPAPLEAVNVTPAALFRKIMDKPTVLFDEVDTIFGSRKQAEQNEDVRGLLNAGHRRSGKAYRCVGQGTAIEVKEFPAYAAVALAGLGRLPDTLLSRSVVVRMRRRTAGERVEPWRHREQEPEGHQLRDRLAACLAPHVDTLRAARPVMPDGVTDRPADVWEPLLALADHAGGDWPARARAAALHFTTESERAPASLGVQLLGDLRAVWLAEGDPDAMTTADIIERLRKLDEAPWDDLRGKPLDSRRLARLLGDYEVRSHTVRTPDGRGKGYRREDLWEPWQRYLSQSPDERDKRDSGDTAGQGLWETSRTTDPIRDKGDASVTPSDPVTSTVTPVTDVTPVRGTGEDPPDPWEEYLYSDDGEPIQ